MKRYYVYLTIAALWIGCGDDEMPTGPGDELVGTWKFIYSDVAEEQAAIAASETMRTFVCGGHFEQSISGEGRPLILTGTWSVTEGYLVSTFTFGDTTVSVKEDYSIRSDTLILVDRAQGSVEKWLQL